jgi:hypothetical protein
MDSGPYNKYIKNNRGNKRLRQFLKKIIKLEIKNDET